MMKTLNNEKGIGIILMVLAVFVLIVVFVGTASTYFNSLYSEINRQQRSLAAHQVLQDFAAMAGRAREVFLNTGGVCNPGVTELDGPNGLCWPSDVGTNSHCVPHPLGNTNPGAPRWVCRMAVPPGPGVGPGVMDVVMQTKPVTYSTAQILQFRINSFRSDFSLGLDIIAGKIQNLAFANSDTSFHPADLALATPVTFAAPIVCPAAVPAALAPYCKTCPAIAGPNLGQCLRLRVCLRSVPCDWASNDQWESQTIGLIDRN